MSDYAEQIEALRVSMKREQNERKAQIELIRAEMKTDTRILEQAVEQMGEAVLQVQAAVRHLGNSVQIYGQRTDARLEGIAAVLQPQVDSVDDSLSIVSGVTLRQADKQA